MKKVLSTLVLTVIMPLMFFGILLSTQNVGAVDIISPACMETDPATGQRVAIPEDRAPAVCRDNADVIESGENPLYGPNGALTVTVRILSIIVGFVSVFVIIIGGLKFINSKGDPNKVALARNTIIYAVVGVAIAAIAQFIVIFILSRIGV